MEATAEKAVDKTLKDFFSRLEACKTIEEKLRLTLVFLQEALAEEGAPRFRHFWEARKLCVPFFQEGVHPAIRAQLWEEFTEISKQARELKDHLDKASAFAAEQYDLAIVALEAEVGERETRLASIAPLPQIRSEVLRGRLPIYTERQKELTILNSWASRLNALRKELAGTAMRLRDKNRLFKRLSALGELVFPRRRELVEEVSHAFIEDVDRFIDGAFAEGEAQMPPFRLREEIQGLQAYAKVLTLSTRAFASSRERLSECWNRVRESDKEHKREQGKQRAAFKEQLDAFRGRIDELLKLETDEATKAIDHLSDEVGSEVQGLDIGPREERQMRDLFGKARQELFGRVKAERAAKTEASREMMEQLRVKISAAVEEKLSLDLLLKQRSELEVEIAEAILFSSHRKQLEQELLPLSRRLVEVEEEELLTTPEGREEVLNRRQSRRSEVKGRIDELKRQKALSGLDLDRALGVEQELRAEKEKLEHLNNLISELAKQ